MNGSRATDTAREIQGSARRHPRSLRSRIPAAEPMTYVKTAAPLAMRNADTKSTLRT